MSVSRTLLLGQLAHSCWYDYDMVATWSWCCFFQTSVSSILMHHNHLVWSFCCHFEIRTLGLLPLGHDAVVVFQTSVSRTLKTFMSFGHDFNTGYWVMMCFF